MPLDTGVTVPQGSSLLLVAEDPAAYQGLATVFAPAGARLLWTTTVVDARHEIAAESPDLVILEGELPAALDLCREIRAGERPVPVLLIEDQGGRRAGPGDGATAVLLRPYPPDDLVARVSTMLRAGAALRGRSDRERSEKHSIAPRREWVLWLAKDLGGALTSMAASAVALSSAPLEGAPARALASLTYELRQTRRLIQDLVDAEALRAGTLALRRHRGDLMALVSEAIEQVAPALVSGEVTAVLDGPERIDANVDRALVRRVFLDILSNAVRYAPRRTKIEIDLQEDGLLARAAFTNRGPPIPAEARARLFEPGGEGVAGGGVGLAFCAAVVRAHGGAISADEPDGGGVRFLVDLPMA